ncbi:PTS system N,N'-diacetylchitobiose-specific IIB component (Lac family) [Breznakia blatticola]|uniref:PTS system N,N'-diacetylchitobiose-specific IIB component (Lac family) n=1 Tax=Breznakia blatticola TaxID=1754012 RepID=A0A4R8A587_9FIRM|nr:PTS sugar transporter subunit IIB [Breznakia blatticola]TDW25804.1 PTS system N,N'-diacetylchitobiose-specific IIB component (Lac family) [Breznakia blatticola]
MNILLVCACGASTSILVEAMKNALTESEADWFIEAKSIQEVKESVGKYDVILMAPQIRYQRKMLEEIAAPYDITVLDIDSVAYGTCNGEKILNSVRSL